MKPRSHYTRLYRCKSPVAGDEVASGRSHYWLTSMTSKRQRISFLAAKKHNFWRENTKYKYTLYIKTSVVKHEDERDTEVDFSRCGRLSTARRSIWVHETIRARRQQAEEKDHVRSTPIGCRSRKSLFICIKLNISQLCRVAGHAPPVAVARVAGSRQLTIDNEWYRVAWSRVV